MRKISICDKTLLVAEGLSFREKAAVAQRLCEMGVDAIVLPPVKRVREETVMNRTVCLSCGETTVKIAVGDTGESLEAAWSSVREAHAPCLCVVLPVSTVQMEYQYHKKAPAMLELIGARVAAAAALCPSVELVAQDASRAEEGFLAEVCRVAKENGATAVTLCDDAGVWMPADAAAQVKEAEGILPVYVCPSEVLHMGTAAAAAAIEAGAAGVVTAMQREAYVTPDTLADLLKAKGEELGVSSGIRYTAIHKNMEEMTRDVAHATGAGEKSSKIRLTGESTLADVTAAVMQLGYDLTEEDLGQVAAEVHRVAAHKESIGARDLEAIIATAAMQVPSTYHLDSFSATSSNVMPAMAQVTLTQGDGKYSGVSSGDGPIDAAFRAIEQIVGHHYELDDFQIQSVTEGRGAIGSALVKLRSNGKLYSGNGASTDIIGASIRAYLNALNKIVFEEA